MEASTGLEAGSDHEIFKQAGADAVILNNMDLKSGYHSPEDTIEDIDKANLQRIVKLALYYIDQNAY